MTLAWEFSRASRGGRDPGFWYDTTASAIRGCGHAVGVAWFFGPIAGLVFGAASTVGQAAAYRMGIRPTMEYAPALRPRVTARQLLAALNRTVGYGVAAWLCAQLAHQPERAPSFALRIGLTIGVVTAVSSASTPVIEWGADHIPERRMGVFGVALILLGFALQSVQYWITLLALPVR